ncbi:MAG: hypothetical protein JWN04_4803, partial [Myxococcaceae bacterium]|nr:hypothetical protein [Myxococcaceae bacterium]
ALLPMARARPSAPPPPPSRVTALPRELTRARSLPPLPPAHARRPFLQGEPIHDAALIASVRVDARGALVSSFGSGDQLAQLVAYIAHVVGLIQADFALDTFQALHAELSGQRMLMFQEGGDVVGLLMQPGEGAQELRQRLGV